MRKNSNLIFPIVVGVILAALAGLLLWPQPASAQCGSQASSCRNCHEVQGQDPVNAKGDWHVQHAFGDFCEFCHAGNVQATDKGAAHEGMITPLADVNAQCASCHPADYAELAQGYATTLGVSLDLGAGGGATTGGDAGSAPSATEAPAPAQAAVEIPPVEQPGVIDFNQQYAESQTGTPINWGNVIVGLLLVVVVAGGGAFAWWNERRLREIQRPKEQTSKEQIPKEQTPKDQSSVASPQSSVVAVAGVRPEVADLLPALQALEPRALKALKKILAEPGSGGEMLVVLAKIDPQLIEEVRRLDRRELNVLMALAGEA